MKRDKKLLVAILHALENTNETFASLRYDQFGDHSQDKINQHMLILQDGNMIVLREPTHEASPPFYPMTVRLAWNGYEWLEKNP